MRGRLIPLAAIGGAIVALGLPAGASAQGGGPFPGDQQPISDEYGLPPLDHPSHAGGAGSGGGGGDVFANSAAGAADTSLRVSDIRRGERRNGGSPGGSGGLRRERVGIGNPIRPPLDAGSDPREGFDVLLLALGTLAGLGILLAGIMQLRRPGSAA